MSGSRIIFSFSLLVLFFMSASFCFSASRKTDQDRVNDLHEIASIIEEYNKVNGHYPFAENWQNIARGKIAVPILVRMTIHELPDEFRDPPPGTSAIVVTAEVFEQYLSNGLGRIVALPRDDRPIKRPEGNWPYFYQFLYDGKNYFLFCFLNTPLPYTFRLAENYYQYEVGSIAIPERKTRRFLDIVVNDLSPESVTFGNRPDAP